jgi:hypothetical protein
MCTELSWGAAAAATAVYEVYSVTHTHTQSGMNESVCVGVHVMFLYTCLLVR